MTEAPMTPEKDEPTILHVPCEHCAARSTPAEATWDDSDGYVDNIYGDQPTPAEALDVRCINCWHDKSHHVHWSDNQIGACVLRYGGGQGQCPCEQYAASPHNREADRE